MTKFVALLPMKAISERVANKNIKLLDGKPLFYYIADSIKASGAFDHICINTDGSDIADLAKSRYQSFVTINPRPSHLCGNDVPMNSIIEFDISQYPNDIHFIQLHATSPLIQPSTLRSAVRDYQLKLSLGYDSLFSATQIKARCFTYDFNPINHNPDELIKTQDLNPVIMENSGFYVFSKKSFKASNSRIGLNPYLSLSELSNPEFLDIDCYSDWLLAENLISTLNS